MSGMKFVGLLSATLVCVLSVGAQQQTNSAPSTNKPTGLLITNRVLQASAGQTNVVFTVLRPDGTTTNISFRVVPSSWKHLEGDFWLPGEFEKALEEKKRQRRQKFE